MPRTIAHHLAVSSHGGVLSMIASFLDLATPSDGLGWSEALRCTSTSEAVASVDAHASAPSKTRTKS